MIEWCDWLLTVQALPIAQPRRWGQGRFAHVPKQHPVHAYKAAVMIACREQGPSEPVSGPVRLFMDFAFPRPKGHWTKKGALTKSATEHHIQRPDLDNIAKSTMDAMTAAGVWGDDSQVVSLSLHKRWADADEMPGVSIRLEVRG